jgi:SAM-dependent methyltransferase
VSAGAGSPIDPVDPVGHNDPGVATFRRLLGGEGQALMASLPPYDPAGTLAAAEAARRAGYDEALVAAALTQSRLRSRARVKFGTDAERLWFTNDGLEQATRPVVARHRAARFAPLAPRRLVDLCCGIAGDLPHLAAVAHEAVGVDRDPLACAVATANLDVLGLGHRATVRQAAVEDIDVDRVDAAYVDPARRGARGRTFRPQAFSPPYSFVLALMARLPATAAKLAPGIPHDLLPSGAEAEWVSVDGDVVECTLWGDALATVPRRATLLPGGDALTGDGSVRGEAGPVGRYVYEPDGAVIRAGLVAGVAALLDGRLLDPTIAYVTCDRPEPTPFATGYEVRDVLPFGLKRLRTLLRARGVGRLTVKKRGSALDPEVLRRQLRLSGPDEATIMLTRVAGAQTVLVVDPLRQQ